MAGRIVVMSAARRAIIGVIVGSTILVGAPALAARRDATTITPKVGIAGVRLREKQAAVQAELGHGRHLRHGDWAGFYSYRSESITILVSYNTAGRVDGVDTQSRAALLYGHPLQQGLAKLEPLLRAKGWQVLSCRGETYTDLGQGGPGTGIAWRNGKLDFVQIDAGGSIGDACLPLPDVG